MNERMLKNRREALRYALVGVGLTIGGACVGSSNCENQQSLTTQAQLELANSQGLNDDQRNERWEQLLEEKGVNRSKLFVVLGLLTGGVGVSMLFATNLHATQDD